MVRGDVNFQSRANVFNVSAHLIITLFRHGPPKKNCSSWVYFYGGCLCAAKVVKKEEMVDAHVKPDQSKVCAVHNILELDV